VHGDEGSKGRNVKRGETRPVKLAPGVEMAFCWIPPGRFRMGSRDGYANEQPVHEVRISDGFWLGRTPVTQRQYAVFDPEHTNGFPGKLDHPAESITWDRAVAYCHWLNQRLHDSDWSGWEAGLPSEAQWEYACRAGSQTEYHTGDGEAALRRAGWFNANAEGSTHPVGRREANSFGLYDMHGNVCEWCRDVWDRKAYRRRAKRGANPEDSLVSHAAPQRVVRGGAWTDAAEYCRAADRLGLTPAYSHHILGLRLALFLGLARPVKPAGREGSERAAGGRAGTALAADGSKRQAAMLDCSIHCRRLSCCSTIARIVASDSFAGRAWWA
jgi:formylglycine-generating enzyme required for sulfatase activity